MVCLFKKTADCQCRLKFRRTSLGHRRLRFSFQINDFKDQDRKNRSGLFSAGPRRRRLFSCLSFRCQAVLFKELSFHQPAPGKERRRRLSSESRSPCQPGFSAFLQFRKPKLPTPTENRRDNQKVSPSMHFSDSIEARRLTDPTTRGKRLFQTPPQTKPRKINSEARRASPSPSEVAIYKLTPRTTRHK